ncbi:MAG: archease [Desulfococcaceae bacterium]
MKYVLTDHTADFGLRIFGDNPAELFSNAAFALSDLISERDRIAGREMLEIHAEGEDWPDLMFNWLRELLGLWTGREFLVLEAKVSAISEYKLTAQVKGDFYDPEKHVIRDEIKAVTYHRLSVDAGEAGWEAGVILDV